MIGSLLGGVGLFLLGMVLMTDALKALSGDALRGFLARFTGGSFSAMCSGALATAIVQSSSATTLTVIGFVSAGLLTFTQAIGLVLGANLGTTSTGWLVGLLGLKFSIGKVALPFVGVGALLRLMARRKRWAHLGMVLAGFGLIFVGIDILQDGMRGLAEYIDLTSITGSGIAGRLVLVLIGAFMTVVMQSSSAAVATTLTAMHGGAIGMDQAAALVIGQNVGTTVTAAIAAIGASVAAKRTSWAHILFNVLTGAVAFVLLPVLTAVVIHVGEIIHDPTGALALAAFHTAFNVLGVMLIFPFVPQFASLVEHMVKDRGPHLTRHLDPSVAETPAVASEAARRTLMEIAAEILDLTRHRLNGLLEDHQAAPRLEVCEGALAETRTFIQRVATQQTSEAVQQRILSIFHAIDHLLRLTEAVREENSARQAVRYESSRRTAARWSDGIEPALKWLRMQTGKSPVGDLESASKTIAESRRGMRSEVLARTARGQADADAALSELEALRWVDRLAYHAWRVAHHLQEQPLKEGLEYDVSQEPEEKNQ